MRRLWRRVDPAKAVTEDDVRACYRLLLGREPDAGGFRAHCTLVGRATVDELVRGFLESPEFQSGRLCREVFRFGTDLRLFEMPGFKLYGWEGDPDIGRAFDGGVYEPHVSRALTELLAPGMVVLDVGANVGHHTMLAASLVGPTGRVIAIEAGRANSDLVRASARENGFDHVTVHTAAAFDHAGVVELHRSRGSNGWIGEDASDRADRVELTPALRLDDLLAELDRLDVVKLDIEGAEHRAVSGALRTIERLRPVVVSEFSPEALRNGSGVDAETYLALFLDRGYAVGLLGDEGEEPVTDVNELLRDLAAAGPTHVDICLRPGS